MDILSSIIEAYLDLMGNYVEEPYLISCIEVGMEYEEYNKMRLLEVE